MPWYWICGGSIRSDRRMTFESEKLLKSTPSEMATQRLAPGNFVGNHALAIDLARPEVIDVGAC